MSRKLKVGEVAELLGVSRQTVYRMAAAGRIPCVVISRRIIRFDADAISDWLQARERGVPEPREDC